MAEVLNGLIVEYFRVFGQQFSNSAIKQFNGEQNPIRTFLLFFLLGD